MISKRLLGFALIFVMICSMMFSTVVSAAGEDLSANVKVSGFRFLVGSEETNVLSSGKTVTAECKLERTNVGTKEQNYCFILQVIDNGRLVDLKKTKGTIALKDGQKSLTVTSDPLKRDGSGLEIIALLVSDMATMAPLAMPAQFKNNSCDIASISVAGYPLALEAGKTDYSMKLKVMESDMPPAIEVLPYDLSTKVTISNITGNSGTAVIAAASHDGLKNTQYHITLEITTMKPAALKNVTIDGKALEGFDPNVLEYRIPTQEGASSVPVITFEKAMQSTVTSVIAATELPGTTVVKTKAADGSESTYLFSFTKTVTVTPSGIGRSVALNNYNVLQVASDQADFPAFQQINSSRPNGPSGADYTYGSVGQMMLIKQTYGYFNFQADLPPDAKIEKAEMNITLLAEDRLDNGTQAYGKLHLDVYENTDTSWAQRPTGEYRDTWKPSFVNAVVNNEIDIPAQPSGKTIEQSINYNISPSAVQGKDQFGFAAEIREKSNSYNTYITVPVKAVEKLPKLKITYYKDYVEPEKLSYVTFDGKPYRAFDPNVYEYKIPSVAGQDASPVIEAVAGASSTAVTVKQATGFPGKATITTQSAQGETKVYQFVFMKTLEVSPFAAAASFTTGGQKLFALAQGTGMGTYPYDKTLSGVAARINDPGRIFIGNGGFDDKAFIAFRPQIPMDAVIDSVNLELNLKALGKIQHVDLYQNTNTGWASNAQGTTVAAAPEFDSTVVYNEDKILTTGNVFNRYNYHIDPSFPLSNEVIAFTAFTREGASWSDYAVLDMKDAPKLKINYYKEDAEPGTVTSVGIDGKKFSEFKPDVYEYSIPTPVGASEVPQLTYTLADDTTATYTPAEGLPGTATIVTSGGNTYRFKFTKTEIIKASAVGNKRYSDAAEFRVPAIGAWGSTEFYNYGPKGTMLMTNWNGSYTNGTSYGYFYFNTSLPEGSTVVQASVQLTAGGYVKNGTGADLLHLDLFENTDTGWVTNNSAYGAANVVPAISSEKINTNHPDIPGNSAVSYSKYTYQIAPQDIAGKTGYAVCALARETFAGYEKYSLISVKTGEEPVLTITYSKD